MIKIAPSILSADFANLEREIKALEDAGADMIHIDVMDGHFVPNLTLGPPIIKALRAYSKLPFDVHLMIQNPEKSFESYIDAGADIVTIHPESTTHVDSLLTKIKSYGVKSGISLLPTTSETIVDYLISKIDLILVMSVNPGFGGQTFMKNQLPKIQRLASKIKDSNANTILAVDGGVNDITAKECIEYGAHMLIAGSYIFNGNYAENIKNLRHCQGF
jgi:ribulose-phosphate 3-epimerase